MNKENDSESEITESGFNTELTDSLARITAENNEAETKDKLFELQTPQQFRDDFSTLAQSANEFVGIEIMQFEVTEETMPIFEALKAAKMKGIKSHLVYDRIAREHIRVGEGQAWRRYNKTVYKGDKERLQQAIISREQLIEELEALGISEASFKERRGSKLGSHNHIKLAIVDNTAWIMTNNLRQIDFEISNFTIKITDPKIVETLKEIFVKTSQPTAMPDMVFSEEVHGLDNNTQLLLDGGEKGESIIYEKASEMAESLQPGDEFIIISQWPPVKMMLGQLVDILKYKIEVGSKGMFLLSPKEYYHPVSSLGIAFQTWLNRESKKSPNFNFQNLARQTHAKAFVIKRLDGSTEVLFGSHNFTKRSVKNGTKELAMWSKDPEIVHQIMSFINEVQAEK